MATYEYKTWETINLPAVSGDTQYIIYDHITSTPGDGPNDDQTGIIYSGLILAGFGIQNLNEILSQYVNPTPINFVSSTTPQQDTTSHFTFYIYYNEGNGWDSTVYDIVIMTYDWGYSTSPSAILSNPITNILDYRQFFLHTVKAGSPDITATIQIKLENTLIDSFQVSGYTYYNLVMDLSDLTYPGEFDYAYSYDFFVDSQFPASVGTKITVGSSTYYIVNTCYRYCIYYLNQFGGWDSLLFRGRELKNDDLSRLSYKKNYVANSTDFHKVDYLTTINEKWSLNTSYLADNESDRMINIMASNKLYLHDLETNHIYPINITNSNCEHKNYKNQGRKMYTYDIEVSSSQPKYRI